MNDTTEKKSGIPDVTELISHQIDYCEREIKDSQKTIERETIRLHRNRDLLEMLKDDLAKEPERQAQLAELHKVAEDILKELTNEGMDKDDLWEILSKMHRILEKE